MALAIQARCPGLRCEVVSGDVTDDLAENALRAGLGKVFQKPYTPRDYDDPIARCTLENYLPRKSVGAA